MLWATSVLIVCAVYVGCGVVFAIPFAAVGVSTIDAAARNASIGFRLLIFPGAVALWPLLAARWARAERHP